jgi:hypothetical protein
VAFFAVDFAVPVLFFADVLAVAVARDTVSFAAATTALAVLAAVVTAASAASAGPLFACFMAAICFPHLLEKC